MLFCKKVPACTAGPLRAKTHCSEAESLVLARQDAENKEYKNRRQTALLPGPENLVAEIERTREDRPEEKSIVRVGCRSKEASLVWLGAEHSDEVCEDMCLQLWAYEQRPKISLLRYIV